MELKSNNKQIIMIFLILTLNMLILSCFKFYYYKYNNITLKIKGNGNINVFSPDYLEEGCSYPENIYINGIIQNAVNYSYYFDKEDNNVTLVWNNITNGCRYLFRRCSYITKIDFTDFDLSSFTSLNGMFEGCSSLISLNLKNFNTGNVKIMQNMFKDCSLLKALDLSTFDTSQVTDMKFMFLGCLSLASLNLSNFNTSSVETMDIIFYNCLSLTSLDISSFDISKITTLKEMFYNCKSLTYLNLSNFINYKIVKIASMFEGCINLEYINLEHFDENKLSNESNKISNIFEGVPDNVVVCLNENITKNIILPQIMNKTCYVNDCSNDWKKKQLIVVKENNTCIEKNEYDLDSTQSIYQNYTDLIDESNAIQKEEEMNQYDIFLQKMKAIFTSENYPTIILDNGENEYKQYKRLSITFTSTKNQKNIINVNNMTAIDFEECETLLKLYNNISLNETLYMMKLDIIQEGMKIPKIEYDIYYNLSGKYLEKLNLSICENKKVSIYIPVDAAGYDHL